MSQVCKRVVLEKKAVNEVLLNSKGTADFLVDVANAVKGRYLAPTNAKVYATKYKRSNRMRAFVEAPYEEASKDNKLLKAIK